MLFNSPAKRYLKSYDLKQIVKVQEIFSFVKSWKKTTELLAPRYLLENPPLTVIKHIPKHILCYPHKTLFHMFSFVYI